MKRFVINFLLFLLPLLLIAGGMEYYLRNRTSQNEVLAKRYLLENTEDVELVFIGNSHGRNAFDPKAFNQNAINVCIGGSTPFYNANFLLPLLDNCPKLKTIVYNISYQTLFYDLDALPDEKKKYEFLHYLGVDAGVNKWSPKYFSVLLSLDFKSLLWRTILSDIQGKGKKWLQTLGFKSVSKKTSLQKLQQSSNERADRHHSIMNLDRELFNISQLQRVEDAADEKGIEVIYVITPVYEKYSDTWKPEYKDFAARLRTFARTNNSQVINFQESLVMMPTDFADPDHLNQNGAAKINQALSAYISSKK